MEMKGKVIVVTGGASGIGAALARRFAGEGAAGIVVADLDFDGARSVAHEVKGLGLRIDVSSEADVQAMIEEATRHFGRVDVLCSNAGIALGGGVEAKLGNNSHWSAKLEYLYIDLGTANFFTNSVSIDVRDHIARVGVNYRF